jgi:tRNA-2-methylthio-N6-dimethylallyladenosine synthase
MNLENNSDNNLYFLETLGCQMNISDSERIASFLEHKGWQRTNNISLASLIIINMCSIRKSAVNRIHGFIEKINNLKKYKTGIRTVLTGCFLNVPEQSKFFKTFNLICRIEELLGQDHYLSLSPKHESPFRARVPIMTGCNNFCSYCVVPYTRGREYSRPAQEIIDEIKELVKNGYREIWLLGQNVNSYQDLSQKDKIDFPSLLSKINALSGDFWIYFTSSHPKDFSDNLIETMAKSKKVAPYLNLPLQSGNNTILQKMNRPYCVRDYQKKVRKLRKSFEKHRAGIEKKITLSTDIIVGFPGETRFQFLSTARLMKKIGFDMAYISQYSPRPLTKAWSLPDNISKKNKKRREIILNNILRKTALKNNRQYLNQIIPVLITKNDQLKKCLMGKSRSYKNIRIESNQDDLIGEIIEVLIIEAHPWGLIGVLKN